MKNIEKLALFLNVLVSLLNPAAAVSASVASHSVGNCLRFAQRSSPLEFQPAIFPVPYHGPMPHPILNWEAIAAVVGGQEEDCERAINDVFRATQISPFAEKLFIFCIGSNENYKITYDYKPSPEGEETIYGAVPKGSDTILINKVAMKETKSSHQTVFHESMHLLFRSIAKHRLPAGSTYLHISQIYPGITDLLTEGKRVVMRSLGLLTYQEIDDPTPIPEFLKKEQTLAHVMKAQFPPLYTKVYDASREMEKKLASNEPLTMIDLIDPILPPGTRPRRIKIDVLNYRTLEDGRVWVDFELGDPLYAALRRLYTKLFEIERNYPRDKMAEESVIAVFQELPPDLIKIYYPGLLERLEQYMDQGLVRNPPQPVYQPRGTDLSYRYPYAAYLEFALQIGLDKVSFGDLMLLAEQLIQYQDREHAPDFIEVFEKMMAPEHPFFGFKPEIRAQYLEALYALKGKMSLESKLV